MFIVCAERLNNLFQIPGQDLIEFVHRQSDAMIRHTVLRKIVRADLFASVARSHLRFPVLCDFRFLLFTLGFDNTRPQIPHGFRSILELRPLILAADDHAGRDVGNTDRRVGRIDTLPART